MRCVPCLTVRSEYRLIFGLVKNNNNNYYYYYYNDDDDDDRTEALGQCKRPLICITYSLQSETSCVRKILLCITLTCGVRPWHTVVRSSADADKPARRT